MRGGQPSTTQPIAGPWLSPKVVTRKRCPKVLNDMDWRPVLSGSPRACQGQMAGVSLLATRADGSRAHGRWSPGANSRPGIAPVEVDRRGRVSVARAPLRSKHDGG